jgi:hypothetical protein
MKVLFTSPIFLPNEEMFNKNYKSISSYVNIFKNCPYEYKIVIGGWSINDEYWNKIIDLCNSLNLNIQIKRFDRNYGKAYVINDLVKSMDNSDYYDYMLTADSDIIFKEIPNFFERLEDIKIIGMRGFSRGFGVVGLMQEEGNCHLIDYLQENSHSYANRYGHAEKLVWNNYPGGIGGGCLFISMINWKKVGGYKVMGVYAGDDAYLLLDTHGQGNSVCLITTLAVIHPWEGNADYQNWKGRVCQAYSNPANTLDDNKIEEATNIWKK